MNIRVNAHYEKLISRYIETGSFASDEEVVQAGLDLLEKYYERQETLRREMQEARDSGPGKPIDAHTVDDIIAGGQQRIAQRKNPA